MPLDSILRRKERIIKVLPTVQNTETRRLLASDLQVSGVYDKAIPSGTPVASATITIAATVAIGATTTATIAVLPAGASIKTGTWLSNNTNCATVNPATGVVTGVASGPLIITWVAADGSGVTATAALNVTNS